MAKTGIRTYSRYSREAVQLLGQLIRVARIEAKLTTQELSERAGISRGLLQRIEKGEMTCAIGSVFEVAAIVGVKLFDAPPLNQHIRQVEDKLTLMPQSVRTANGRVDDDF